MNASLIPNVPGHVVLTGATGYIGARVLDRLLELGCHVTSLGRRAGPETELEHVRHVPWSFESPVPAEAFAPANGWPAAGAIIHLAHDWNTDGRLEDDVNLLAIRKLLEASRRRGVIRFVFGSSVAARAGAQNRYGRIKAAAEAELSGPDEIAARIGMVYGGEMSGQWGMMNKLIRLPVLPMLDPWRRVQPIHIADLAEALVRISAAPQPRRNIYGLADPAPLPFGRFLRHLARLGHGRRVLILPVPSRLALWLVGILNRVPVVPKIDRERILGLAGLPVIETADDLTSLGVQLRPLGTGLAESDRRLKIRHRKALLREGHVHLSYVAAAAPRGGLLRDYARAIERNGYGDGAPILYGGMIVRFPGLMRYIEPPLGTGPVRQRLRLAFHMSELSGALASDLFDYQGAGRARAWLMLSASVLVEGLCLAPRLLALPLMRR